MLDILIRYIENYNAKGEKVYTGAYIVDRSKLPITKKEIYVGFNFSLEDVLYKKEVANMFNVDDKDRFIRRYNSAMATGIVYFPQTQEYGFLQEGDVVLPWTGEDKVQETLDNYINKHYTITDVDNYFKKIQDLDEKIKDLTPEDPLVELYGYNLKREASSR